MKILTYVLFVAAVAKSSANVPQRESNPGNETSSDVILNYGNEMVPVLRFCCERHYFFDFVNRTCIHSGERLEPHFYTREGKSIDEVNFLNITEQNQCPSYMISDSEFRILSTGEIQLRDINSVDMKFSDTLVSNNHFCLLWLQENNAFKVSALVCFPEEHEDVSMFRLVVHNYIIPISMAISAIFLAATFVIYCLVSELQDLLGKSFMCSVAAMCFSKVFGVLARTISNRVSFTACSIIGLLMHLGFLLAFFWLNVISVILFVSVCFQGKISCHSRKKWFIFGSLYAFGVPLLLMGLVIIHDFTNHFDNSVVPKPGFGVAACGFTNRGAQVVYFYAPISILIGINLILFCASACRLFILSKQSSAFVFQFNHYLKLLVLMGIPWIFEVLSFFLGGDDQISVATFVWLAFDLFNALQGVVIFLVFACRRAVFARVSETICGSVYARNKFPEVFLQHANEETNEAFTQDLRLMDADSRS